MTIFQKRIDSPLGNLFLIGDDSHLLNINFNVDADIPFASKKHKILDLTHKELDEYFKGKRKSFTVPLKTEGTKFQNSVWNSLLKIPYGETWSYKELAIDIKNPKAVRAVGGANGRNPICIIIPCHRVVAHDGTLGGYTGGTHIKEFLLKLEGVL